VETETAEWDARFLRQLPLFRAWTKFEHAVETGGKVFRGSYEDGSGENTHCELRLQSLARGGVGITSTLQAFGESMPVTVRIMELPVDPKAQQTGTSSTVVKLVALGKGFSLMGTYASQDDDIHGTFSYKREGESGVLSGNMELTFRTEEKSETKYADEGKGLEHASARVRAAVDKLTAGVSFSGTVRKGDRSETYHVQIPKQGLPDSMGASGVAIRATHSGGVKPISLLVSVPPLTGAKLISCRCILQMMRVTR